MVVSSCALLYVDDALVVHHDAETMLKQIDKYFQMKPGAIGDPSYYLGARLCSMKLPNGVQAWAMSPSKYLQNAVRNVKEYLKKKECSGNTIAGWLLS
jgi:hypothetical protein